MEQWKKIPQSDYSASNLGRIRLDNSINGSYKGRIIEGSQGTCGYLMVTIKINGEKKPRYLHRIIASVWIENQKNLPCVNHLDGNKTNNNVQNLEWVTHKRNNQHAYESKLREIYRIIDRTTGISYSDRKEVHKSTGVPLSTIGRHCKDLVKTPRFSYCDEKNNLIEREVKGYSFYPTLKKYRVSINIEGKKTYFGFYETEEEAKNKYLEIKSRINRFTE